MLRESQIPLFLWIATAIVVHMVWGGGADQVAEELGETDDVRNFTAAIRAHAGVDLSTTEIALWQMDDTTVRPSSSQPKEDDENEEDDSEEPEDAEPSKPQPSKKAPPEPQVVPKPTPVRNQEQEQQKKEEQKKEEDEKKVIPVEQRRRIAVKQHVTDDQQQNPDAEFIADQANRVEEQTQARITATDQNDPKPTPGRNFSGPTEAPGNSSDEVLGQSEESSGETSAPVAAASRSPSNEESARAPGRVSARQEAIEARKPIKADPGAQELPQWLTGAGSGEVPAAQEAREARQGQQGRAGRLPKPGKRHHRDLLGLGAEGTTKNGTRLNLTHRQAINAIGQDQLAAERKKNAERRLAQHRGSFKALGIERWRGAIENYVPSVKPGNQTALNTARVPFASYLNKIHNQLHPVFAHSFLTSLNSHGSGHPLNRKDMSTNLEIVLSREDGKLVRMGVTKTSGVTSFDLGALESVFKAQPFGPAPKEIVSPDGNVYLHWEFHRNPIYACSTYFARPFMLKVKPKTAPPREEPPPAPFRPGETPERDRHGSRLPWPKPAARTGVARLW